MKFFELLKKYFEFVDSWKNRHSVPKKQSTISLPNYLQHNYYASWIIIN